MADPAAPAGDTPPAAPQSPLDTIRAQHPEYAKVDDDTLARGMYNAHPEYKEAMSYTDFASKVGVKAATPPPAAPGGAKPEPGMGTQLWDAGKDIVGGVARGGADVVGALSGDSPSDMQAREAKWTAPFQHPDDSEPGIHRAVDVASAMVPGMQAQHAAGQIVQAGTDALPENARTLVTDVARPVGHIAQAVGTVMGARSALGAGADAADTAINAVNKPSAAEASTLKSTPQITRLRADGFKIAGGDVRAASNGPEPGEPADIHGTTSSSPDVLDTVQRHNQAQATQSMASDVKLPNTRAINPDEVKARMDQEGAVYGQVGDAIGKGRTPTPQLDHELSIAAPSSATDAGTAANAKLVQQYRDHYSKAFDGPEAVQAVRDLRAEGNTGMANADVDAQSAGRTKIGIANAIENEMMRQLPASAQDLKTQFPQARMQLAKLHELQEVTEGGQVNANKVLQMKRSGAPLSGAADAVANASDVAPESMSRARGTADIIPYAPTHMGVIRDVWDAGKRLVHKIPGMDPTTDAYQTAHYGPEGGADATPPASAAPKVSDIPPPVDLKPPPGEVGPAHQRELPLAPGKEPAPPYELTPPEGTAHEPYQHDLVNPPSRTNTPRPLDRATWDRAVMDTVNRYKGEQPSSEGPSVSIGTPPPRGTVLKPQRELTPAEKLRARLGEAMK